MEEDGGEEEALPCRIQRKALEMIVQDHSVSTVLDALLRDGHGSTAGTLLTPYAHTGEGR